MLKRIIAVAAVLVTTTAWAQAQEVNAAFDRMMKRRSWTR